MLYGSDCDDEPRAHCQITVFAEEHDEQFRVRFDDETASQTLDSPVQNWLRPTRKKGILYAHACQLHSLCINYTVIIIAECSKIT